MDSPSVNLPSKYLEGLIGDSEASTPVIVACSLIDLVTRFFGSLFLLGDNYFVPACARGGGRRPGNEATPINLSSRVNWRPGEQRTGNILHGKCG